MDKVSVIIPTYNRETLIKRAVESVLRQTYHNFEIIIIDDGSTDNTEKIVKSFNNEKITYKKILHSGVSKARNVGIKISNGKWIAFLDSDDVWIETKLEKQIQYLNKNSQFYVCHTDEIWIKNGIRINQGKKHKKYEGEFFTPSLKLCLISPSSIIIHRDIFKEIGYFDEDFEFVEDYELWLRLTSRYKIGYIDEKLVIKYGGHKDQLSRKIDAIEKYRMLAIEKFIRNNYMNKLMASYITKAFAEYSRKYKIFYTGCLKRGKIKELSELKTRYVEIESLVKNINKQNYNTIDSFCNKKLQLTK